jgi:hypothetical protein
MAIGMEREETRGEYRDDAFLPEAVHPLCARSGIGDEFAEWILEMTMVFGWKLLLMTVLRFITLIVLNDKSSGGVFF